MTDNFMSCDDCKTIYSFNVDFSCDICQSSISCSSCIGFHTYEFDKFIYFLCDECAPQKTIKKTIITFEKNKNYQKDFESFKEKIDGLVTLRNVKDFRGAIPLDDKSGDILMVPIIERISQ